MQENALAEVEGVPPVQLLHTRSNNINHNHDNKVGTCLNLIMGDFMIRFNDMVYLHFHISAESDFLFSIFFII